MQDTTITPMSIIAATKSLLPRLGLGYEERSPAHLLLKDQAAFIGAAIGQNCALGIKQESLASMLNCSQSTISRAASDWSPRQAPPISDEAKRA